MRARRPTDRQVDWLRLLERAMDAAAEGITVADARAPDRPLIYVNDGFERLTGYAPADALGRNCRFLQGEETDADTVAVLRRALDEGRDCTVEIRNRHKDGTPFWNRLSVTPVRDERGELTHFIGVQSDVTARREAEEGLRRANAQMRRDLQEAAAIQQAWLPRALPEAPGYAFGWRFRPCEELAGDSLNIVRLDDDHVGVYILDVTGHGVPAALLSATLSRWLSPLPEESCLFTPTAAGGHGPAAPAVVAATLNRQFVAGPETGRFFTMLYGVLDLPGRSFRYVTAGHPPPVRITATGAEVCPAARGVPIGVVPGFEFREKTVALAPGDRLLLFTDGAFEAIDADDRELGERRLLDALVELHGRPPGDALAEMVRRVEAWCPGGLPQDDVTLLAFDVLDV